MASPALVHVAVDKKELQTSQRCSPEVLRTFLALLAKLGTAMRHPHPGLLGECAVDSVGFYLDEPSRAEAARAQLVSGNGVRVELRSRRFDVLTVEAADKLPSVRRRQCVAIRGTNEVARRLGGMTSKSQGSPPQVDAGEPAQASTPSPERLCRVGSGAMSQARAMLRLTPGARSQAAKVGTPEKGYWIREFGKTSDFLIQKFLEIQKFLNSENF